MSTPPTRRRRHSPAVYRRRRLVLLLGVVLIAAIVWALIAQPWRGWAAEPVAAPTPSASSTPRGPAVVPEQTAGEASDVTNSETANAAPDDSGGVAETSSPTDAAATPADTPSAEPCVAQDLTVEALTDKESYASGENPQFSIRLTNSGEVDCALNVGTSTQRFTVASGGDTWWRSTDCQAEPSDMLVLLTAGQSVVSATPVVWDRTRSAVGTCDATDRPRAPGGGSTYHLTVEIGGVSSAQTAAFMLY